MPRPKPPEENVVISFRAKLSGDRWIRDEAKRRQMSRTELCREVFRLGVMAYQKRMEGRAN